MYGTAQQIALAPGSEPCASCGARADSVCAAINDEDLARLAGIAIGSNVAAGQTFIHEGDPAADFFNITEGTARLFKQLPDGRRQITGFARLGDFLGLSHHGAYTLGAEAIDAVRLCRFPRASLRAVLDDFPSMERALLRHADDELAAAQDQMLLLGRKTALERLASFLVARSTAAHPCARRLTRIALPMTRGDIADYLGLTIETVSRTFTRLKLDGMIDLPSPQEVVILRPAKLEAMAGGL